MTQPAFAAPPPHAIEGRMSRLRFAGAIALAFTLTIGAASAYWNAVSSPGGSGTAAALTINQGATPTVSALENAVTVAWAPSTLSDGSAVDGYIVERYDLATLTWQAIQSACTGTVTATTCVETGVPVGEWVYSVTPSAGTNWRGAESAKSVAVTVGNARPVAAADSYSVNEDATLNPSAPGVLANDTDAELDTLTAILVTGVASGALTLNANGGFSYVPEANFSGSDSFTYKANDGLLDSTAVTVTVTVTAVNDAPLNAVPVTQQSPKNTNRVFSSANNNRISISDADAGGATVEVQLTATSGTVTLPVLTGLTFFVGDGTSDATMTFRGTITNINLRLDGATFIPTNNFTGTASLQITTNDLGNVGSGGASTDTDTVIVKINALGIFTANQDIGVPPGTAGSASYTAGTYTVAGSGADIWNNDDHFQYVSVPMIGDGRLTARAVSQVQTPAPASSPAKAGVMFRETTAGGSRHETADVMQAYGFEYIRRATTGGPSSVVNNPAGIAAPYWVRLTRVGNAVTAERSSDGTTWVAAGTAQTTTMGSTIYAGLAVSAVDTTKLNTATFDNVAITTPPTAASDTYTVNEDTTLNVAASGVLVNDTDPESNILTAVLVSGTTGLTLNANGSFTYVPPGNFSGATSFTYKANDGVFDSNTVTVNLTVKAANETPSFTSGANQSVAQGSDAQTVTGWATAITPGTGESGQLINFIVTNDDNSLFTAQPAVNAAGVLSYTPSSTIGVATVSVRVQDNGGTANGAVDISAIQTFTISVTADIYGPTGGSVDAGGLVGTGARYATSTVLSINLDKGTDPSGVAATGAQLKRATATLSSAGGTADGTCGSFGTYTLVSGGTDPVSPKSDTVTDQACYSYQYVVLDTNGYASTYTSPNIKVDTTAPAAPALAHNNFANTSWSGGGSTVVHYRPGASTGAFTATATSVDAASGIASYAFPALGTNWTSTPGSPGVNTYAWSGSPAAPGTKNVTATNNAGGVSANAPFTLTADSTAPTGSTMTYTAGTFTSTSVSVSFTTGTDGGSGIGTRLLQRASAPLTGSTCGTYGAFATVTNGTNPTSPLVDTVSGATCSIYQYVVADNVGNLETTSSANVVKVTMSYFDTVSTTSGLLSYWRLGEGSAALGSSDSFTGTAAALLTARAGEVGATWAYLTGSANTERLSDVGRARRNGTGYAINYTTATPASADYAVEADLFVKSNLAGDRVGVIGRLDTGPASGSYYMARWEPEDNSWNLMEVTNGSHAYLSYVTVAPLVVGQTYRLRLTMTGTALTLHVNGVLTVSASDGTLTNPGRAGISDGQSGSTANKSDTTGIHFDDFQVTPSTYPRATDSKGTNTGDYLNGPTLGVTGAIATDGNTAAQFDGLNDSVTVARQISTDFSVEFWFKSTQTYGAGCTYWWQGARLVDAEVAGGNDDFGTSLCGGRVIAGVGAASGDGSIVSAAGYNNGAWHHVVFTRTQSTGGFELFIDGASVGTATAHTRPLTASPVLTFGRSQSRDSAFVGTLDEIAVYTTVLSPATVTAHRNAGL